jgi:tetratricopeptide (TPR) repeat protein
MSPRLTGSLSPSRPPAETVFRRPAGHVEPPPEHVEPPVRVEPGVRVEPTVPVEPVVHVPPVEPVEPPTPAEPLVPTEPIAPNEPSARPKLIVSAEILTPVESAAPGVPEPAPIPTSAPTLVVPPPPTNVVHLHERREPWSLPERRDFRPIEFPELQPGDLARSVRPSELDAPTPEKEPDTPGLLPRRRRSKISPHARPHRVLRSTGKLAEAGVEPSASESDVPRLGGGPIAPVQPLRQWDQPAEPKPKRDSPLVETCFALYQEKRYSEVVSTGEEMLAKLPVQWPAGTSHDIAALQSVIGLAKQALCDDDGARLALEAAIEASPETERPTYSLHLAALSLEAAQARLARAAGHDTGDRIATIRSAIAWSERGLAAVASDAGLAGAREAAYDALWHAYELSATALLQRQDFGGARQLLREALDDPALPAVRAAGFRGLFSSTFGAEVGQLTAQAILGMQEGHEVEALESLKKAEVVLASIPGDALPPTRRAEVDQRLWWGYAELGSRRLEAGEYEEALDPLIHALRFESIGAERQAETRAAIVRALEGISAMRAMSIRRLADAGCHDEAVEGAEDLRKLLRDCVDLGISEMDLWAAYTRILRLSEELDLQEPA